MKCKTDDKRRVQGIYKSADGEWAFRINNLETAQVKSYTPQHTCCRDQYNRHCNLIFIVHQHMEQFKANSEWKTQKYASNCERELEY